MMSSEEDVTTVDSFGLVKKTKRSRQRVDAGEPRNSYSSIPNFSSRPNLLNTGVYSAFFSAAHQQQQFAASAFFNHQAFGGPTKMLNELLCGGRRTLAGGKSSISEGSVPLGPGDHSMMTVDVSGNSEAASAISGTSYEQQPIIGMGSLNGTASPPTSVANIAAHHMLRNILQGRKQELYALEQELRAVSGNANSNNVNRNADLISTAAADIGNNNFRTNINNFNNNNNNNKTNVANNNNNNNSDEFKSANLTNGGDNGGNEDSSSNSSSSGSSSSGDSTNEENKVKEDDGGAADSLANRDADEDDDNNIMDVDGNEDIADQDIGSSSRQSECTTQMLSSGSLHHRQQVSSSFKRDSSDNNSLIKDNYCGNDLRRDVSDCEDSPPSVENKDEFIESLSCRDFSQKSTTTTDSTELKKARVENIVSSMRCSPSLPTQVNGCKKRKLYHPQQHDNSASERYSDDKDIDVLSEDEDVNLSPSEIRQKVLEKNALKHKLRSMQEQLKKMQHKYAQLSTQVDQDEETEMQADREEDVFSDMDQDENCSIPSGEKDAASPPPAAPQPATPIKKEHGAECVVAAVPTSAQPLRESVSPAISKILPAKLLPQNPPIPPQINPHSLPLHPSFNGTLSFLQHQMLQEQQQQVQNQLQSHHPHHHHHHHHNPNSHQALSNAAAMYLGVSHKFLLEQEARLAKEAALMVEQQHHQQQHQPQHFNHQNLQRPLQQIGSHHQQLNQPHHHPGSNHQQPTQHHDSQRNESHPHQPHPLEHSPKTHHRHSPAYSTANNNSNNNNNHHHHHGNNGNNNSSSSSSNKIMNEFSDKLQMLKNNTVSADLLLGFVDILKCRIPVIVPNLIEEILAQYLEEHRLIGKSNSEVPLNSEQSSKEPAPLSDRKSPRTKVIDRGNSIASANSDRTNSSSNHYTSTTTTPSKVSHNAVDISGTHHQLLGNLHGSSESFTGLTAPHRRPIPNSNAGLFPSQKMASNGMTNSNAAALYNSINMNGPHANPFCMTDMRDGPAPEQNEALSLVVAPKKKRHKVTDTRITPRTVSRILAQDGGIDPPAILESPTKYGNLIPPVSANNGGESSPPPRPYHHLASGPVGVPPPVAPVLPVSLPTSVAIPNPGLHESQVFSPYTSFYTNQHQASHHIQPSRSSPIGQLADSPPLHHTSLFHPALLAAAAAQQQQQQQQQRVSSPDYMNMRSSSRGMGGTDSLDRGSDCNSIDGGPYDGMTPSNYSSTLTPMHLRKAKLMFFWVRYPSSSILKMYFPDIKFNKNNTAQLVKWFSNFREFYYIQMEKYARQAVSEGLKNADDLHVSGDCEIYRVLNLHYNRNNHIDVPVNFRYVVEQTLKEFFKAIQTGKDTEQSWKKAIYKVISRLDDPVPEYFKSPNFLEQLE